MKKKRIIELAVASVLLIILLTLFIPKFMDAQVTAKIAQAKMDIERIMKAVNLLQQDMDNVMNYQVNLYNDVLGDTTQKVYFQQRVIDETQMTTSMEYAEMKRLFFEYLGDIPVQQLPVDLSQDAIEMTYHKSFGSQIIYDDYVYHSGFTFEKSPYDYQAPGFMDINLNNKFPSITIPHNKPDLVYTPGPVLLPLRPRQVVYTPTNGMMSHGYIVFNQ
jgi:hypothetical protein